MTRDPHSVLREIVLWRDTLEDLKVINRAAGDCADKVAGAAISVVELAIGGDKLVPLQEIAQTLRSVMDAMNAMQVPLDGIVTRSELRLPELQAELDQAAGGDHGRPFPLHSVPFVEAYLADDPA